MYAIYEVYENYDEIMKYIKKRLMAIIDMHEKSINFNNDLDTSKSRYIWDYKDFFNLAEDEYNFPYENLFLFLNFPNLI